MRPKSLDGLTMARFVAAACVVVSHLHGRGMIQAGELHTFLDGGRPAVAFFFVLSGFVLAYNYRDLPDRVAVQGFWVARFARLYPIHLLGLAIAAVPMSVLIANGNAALLGSGYGLKTSYGVVAGHQIGAFDLAAVSLAAQLLMLTAWLPFAPVNQPWNGPAWSISCEAFFYAAFPALVRPIQHLSTRRMLLGLAGLWALQGAWVAALQLVGAKGFLISQFPLTHLFEFVLGIAVAQLFIRHEFDWLRRRAGVVLLGCAAVAALLGLFSPVTPKYFLLSPLFGLVILTMAAGDDRMAQFPGRRFLVLLGEASYALYIVHMPILMTYQVFGAPFSPLVLVLIVLAAAIAAHLLVEEPLRRRIRATWAARPWGRSTSLPQRSPPIEDRA
jgi:peptidoglycan/LPS O-acetylase OafA/YrhL